MRAAPPWTSLRRRRGGTPSPYGSWSIIWLRTGTLIQRMEEAGADRVVVPAPRGPESEVLSGLERLAEQVLG